MIYPIRQSIPPEEYLAREEKAEYKSEYHDGEVYALAGGSVNHNQICINTTTALAERIAGKPCRVFMSDVRLYVEKSGLYAYPDVMLVRGRLEFDPRQKDTITNPLVIIEVWSESTQSYDRGAKFAMYRRIPTLQDYVMIDQTQPYVEHFRREGHFWVLETLDQMDAALFLRSIDAQIPLQTIYAKVEWHDEE